MGAVVWRNLVEGASPSHSGLQSIAALCRLVASKQSWAYCKALASGKPLSARHSILSCVWFCFPSMPRKNRCRGCFT